MKVVLFPDFMPCISLEVCRRFDETDTLNLILEPDDGNNRFFLNTGNFLPYPHHHLPEINKFN